MVHTAAWLVAEKIAVIVLTKVWDQLQPAVTKATEASRCMEKNHSRFVEKMNTLRALRDDLRNRSTKHKSTKERTMDDWFHRVMAVEKLAQELESRFTKKQEGLTRMHVVPRSKFSKQMANMCLEIGELVIEGNKLWDTFVDKIVEPVVKDLAPDIPQDLKATRVLGSIQMENMCAEIGELGNELGDSFVDKAAAPAVKVTAPDTSQDLKAIRVLGSIQMENMSSEIGELVMKGNELGDSFVDKVAEPVVKVTAPDIQQDIKPIRVLGNHHLVLIYVTVLMHVRPHDNLSTLWISRVHSITGC